ncbi:hypothetical protein B0H13DRAFT_1942614 [Mycena leptocephala]|nr:hypothetical protein B0H13DRAFT_1942614 [Mycena leptocephala]
MQSVKGLPVRTEVPVALPPSLLPSLAVAGQEEVVARVKIVTRRNARCRRLERDRWNASILISSGQRSVTERILEGQGGEDIDDGDFIPALMIYIPLTDIIDTWTCALRLPEVFVDNIRTDIWPEFGRSSVLVQRFYTTTKVGRTAGEEARNASVIQVLSNSHAKRGSPFYINEEVLIWSVCQERQGNHGDGRKNAICPSLRVGLEKIVIANLDWQNVNHVPVVAKLYRYPGYAVRFTSSSQSLSLGIGVRWIPA